MTNVDFAAKWGVPVADLDKTDAFFEKHRLLHPALRFLHFGLAILQPSQVNMTVGPFEEQAAKGLVVTPLMIAIIFGVLSSLIGLVAPALAPQIQAAIQMIIDMINKILPVPLPPLPTK